ncbi:hypothetical protein FOA52_015920 [Chlamydomonas sp. UWO 241]|nr:hypothetical protein FOA52_015920 [Chlamydomonas sp. UWO 241]
MPVGSPVSFELDKDGVAWVTLSPAGLEAAHLKVNPKCSLMVQPSVYPARAVACVTLMGELTVEGDAPYQLRMDKAMYFGGLDATGVSEVSPEAFQSAVPDVLHKSASDLVKLWNEERAEDLYRIVSHQLQVPLTDMQYAELVWVDRLGMYMRTEVEGRDPEVVRVPFYRPVIDERDARSVITMAAQISWEAERSYQPSPVPATAEAGDN